MIGRISILRNMGERQPVNIFRIFILKERMPVWYLLNIIKIKYIGDVWMIYLFCLISVRCLYEFFR